MELAYPVDLLHLHVYRTSHLPLGSFHKQLGLLEQYPKLLDPNWG
jgi:hypothetical protein